MVSFVQCGNAWWMDRWGHTYMGGMGTLSAPGSVSRTCNKLFYLVYYLPRAKKQTALTLHAVCVVSPVLA